MKAEDIYDFSEIVQTYLNYLSVIKGKSNLTVLEYASDLKLFFAFQSLYNKDKKNIDEQLIDSFDVSTIDLELIKSANLTSAYAFLRYCKDTRHNDNSARARKIVSIRQFYRYLNIQNILDSNPMENLESPKIKQSLPKYLTLDQATELLKCVDGKFKERDYCILVLFLNCGLRLSELVSLNCTDIRSDNTATITGKGNKQRTIYLNAACVEALQRYMAVRPVEGVKDREALFISRQMNRISKRMVQQIVYNFLDKIGLGDQGLSVHKLRHTAATLMYQHGHVDVLQLKEILGHENLSTTEIYTHLVDEQLRNAIDSNPLNSVRMKESPMSVNFKSEIEEPGEEPQNN